MTTAEFEAGKMRRQQQNALATCSRGLEMLQTFDPPQRCESSFAGPPRQAGLHDRDSQRGEMLAQHTLLSGRIQFRETQFDVAPCDRRTTACQRQQRVTQPATEPHQHRIRQQNHQAQNAEADPRRPEAWMQQLAARDLSQ